MKGVFVALIAWMVACASIQPVSAAESGNFTETVLYSFCSQAGCADGTGPTGVIAVKGTLYGTTIQGGSGCVSQPEGCGTVFSLDPNTDAETVLYSFCSDQSCGIFPLAPPIDVKGKLYGTTQAGGGGDGVVFAVNRKTGAE